MPRRTTSLQRRHLLANRILLIGLAVMRPCSHCVSFGLLCVMSDDSEHCAECVRTHRWCELAPPSSSEWERLHSQEQKLAEEALAAEAKTIRLRKQRRLIQKKLRDMGDREMKNILDLEMDEMLLGAPIEPAEVLNPSSPRSPSFLDPALLGSPDRTPAEPLGSQ